MNRDELKRRGIAKEVKERDGYVIIAKRADFKLQFENLDSFTGLNGKLVVTITALQPLHIGSGDYVVKSIDNRGQTHERLAQAVQCIRGVPVIPGSSIKGAVKTIAMLYTKNEDNLFGSSKTGASRLLFSDALPLGEVKTDVKDIKERYRPKDNKGGIKFYFDAHEDSRLLGGKSTSKETIEVIKPGAKFSFEIVFKNVRDYELGLLCISMGIIQNKKHGIKLGGAKSQGLGLVRFDINYEQSYYFEKQGILKNHKERISPPKVEEWIKSYFTINRDKEELLKNIQEWLCEEYRV